MSINEPLFTYAKTLVHYELRAGIDGEYLGVFLYFSEGTDDVVKVAIPAADGAIEKLADRLLHWSKECERARKSSGN